MDNVIINFTKTGLDEIVEEVKVAAGKSVQEFQKLNVTFKENQANIEKTTSSMDGLAKASQAVEKTITNGATNATIKATGDLIDKNTKSTTAQTAAVIAQKDQIRELTVYIEDLQKKSNNAAPGKGQQDYNKKLTEAKFDLQGLNTELKKLEDEQKKVNDGGQKQGSIFRELKKEQNEYTRAAEEAYAAGNKAFGDELNKKAGEVADRISDIRATTKAYASDTATFDAIGAGIRGIGAGFQIAQGTQALFGEGNKDLEKQLVKIQATMALVNGLTEVQNLLQKESALRIGLTNAQNSIRNVLERSGITFKTAENTAEATGETIKKRVIVVQAVENGLQSESVIVRGAATAAQWLLNNAMLAFPLIAIIAGLAVIIGLFGNFGDSINKSAESQIKLNALQQESLEIMKAQDDFLKSLSKDREESIQQEIDLLIAQKASTEQIRIKEKQLQQERSFNAAFQKGYHSEEIDFLEKNQLAVIGLTAKLASLNAEKAKTGSDAFDKQIDAIKGQLDIANQLVATGEQARKDAADASLEHETQALQQANAIQLEGLAQQKDVLNSKLRFAREAGNEQLALQLALAKNERDTSIANLKASNESRADIEAAYLEKQLNLNEIFQNSQLNKKKDLVTAELTAVRIGSGAELDLKLKGLEIENQIELNNRKLTDEKKRQLTATYLKAVSDMLYDFAKKQKDNELNTQVSLSNAQLQFAERDSAKEVQIKQNLLALQEQLELNNIDRNIQGTELGEAKKNEIIANYAEKNIQLQISYTETILKIRESELNETSAFLQQQADLEAANGYTTETRKQALQLEAFDNRQAQADKEYDINSQRYLAGELTEQQYYETLLKYQDDYLSTKQERQNAADAIELEKRKELANAISDIAQTGLQAASIITQSNLEHTLAVLDKDTAANDQAFKNKQITENQYLANKEKIDIKIAAAKSKAAKADREIALFTIGINTAQAAIKAFATAPNYIVGAVEAALALAFGAVQYAAAASKPIPEFAKGTEYAPKGWAWVGEKGPELVYLNAGSKVRTHEDSNKMVASTALRNSMFEHTDRSPVPSKTAELAMSKFGASNPGINYEMLSKVIGKEIGVHLSKMPLTNISLDKHGFNRSIQEGSLQTQFLDTRYSSN